MPSVMITVETGAGLTDSNSYVTLAETETILEPQREYNCFKDLEPDDKVQAIVTAARYLDVHFRFYGVVLYPDQALQWPRSKNYDEHGFIIKPGVIPTQLKEANARLALEWGRLQTGLVTRLEGSGSVTKWSADGVEIEYDTDNFSSTTALLGTRYTQVELRLRS